MENTLALATYGTAFFEGGEPAVRALIAKTLGVRYVLTNKSLAIEMHSAFSPLREIKNAAETGSASQESGDPSSLRQVWWSTLDSTRNMLLESNFSVPDFINPLKCPDAR